MIPTTSNKGKFLISFLLFTFTTVICCQALSGQGRNPLLDNLEKRIKEYYMYEKNKEWDSTYLYRTPLFRKSVPFGVYKDIMSRDNQGWTLLGTEIVNIKVEDNFVYVEIRFIEEYPKGYLPSFLKKRIMEIKEITLWEEIDGEWYARNPGGRGHLSLNVDLVR